jgi:hypothetical protein
LNNHTQRGWQSEIDWTWLTGGGCKSASSFFMPFPASFVDDGAHVFAIESCEDMFRVVKGIYDLQFL